MAIASCLVDTNILLRATQRFDPQHSLVDKALKTLLGQAVPLFYTHQNIAELWNVMTRPVARNGFGLGITDVNDHVHLIESAMRLLGDNEAVYWEWKRIVVQHAITGVHVHDARLAAAMRIHGIEHILTLNVSDFTALMESMRCTRTRFDLVHRIFAERRFRSRRVVRRALQGHQKNVARSTFNSRTLSSKHYLSMATSSSRSR